MPHFTPKERHEEEVFVLRSRETTLSHDTRSERITTKNRRKRYLDLHPEYFTHPDLELADPLLYDRLVRRFQSAHEREQDGRQRGFTGVLEADLVRSEAKVTALQHPDPDSPLIYRRGADGSITAVEPADGGDETVLTKEKGWSEWVDVMGRRFLRGDDQDFDYATVDRNEDLDDHAEEDRVLLDAYLMGENEEYLGEGHPQGETGIQDF